MTALKGFVDRIQLSKVKSNGTVAVWAQSFCATDGYVNYNVTTVICSFNFVSQSEFTQAGLRLFGGFSMHLLV